MTTARAPHAPWVSTRSLHAGPAATPAWFVAARSDELRGGPVGRQVNGTWIVLYRDSRGAPVALEDRCPHKNVALSLGAVSGDTLRCRYHGWRISGDGSVVDVPCHAPGERLPACRVPTFHAVEQDDWIWVRIGEPASVGDGPPRYPKDPHYRWFELHNVVRAPLDLVLENGLDCSHTGFAHEGLFRSAPSTFITARIEETPSGVRVETLGERGAGTGDARSVLSRRRAIRHVDEVILPHTLKVDYWIGDYAHLVTVLVCTPEDELTTRLYTRMGVWYRGLTPLVTRYVRWMTRRIVAQDLAVLNSQGDTIRRFGRRDFVNVSADQPAQWMQRVYRLAANGRYPGATLRARDVVYKL